MENVSLPILALCAKLILLTMNLNVKEGNMDFRKISRFQSAF